MILRRLLFPSSPGRCVAVYRTALVHVTHGVGGSAASTSGASTPGGASGGGAGGNSGGGSLAAFGVDAYSTSSGCGGDFSPGPGRKEDTRST